MWLTYWFLYFFQLYMYWYTGWCMHVLIRLKLIIPVEHWFTPPLSVLGFQHWYSYISRNGERLDTNVLMGDQRGEKLWAIEKHTKMMLLVIDTHWIHVLSLMATRFCRKHTPTNTKRHRHQHQHSTLQWSRHQSGIWEKVLFVKIFCNYCIESTLNIFCNVL